MPPDLYDVTDAELAVLQTLWEHGAATIRTLADKAAIQMNDTHPSIAVAELMRLLMDVHDLPWKDAWQITIATLGEHHLPVSEADAKHQLSPSMA